MLALHLAIDQALAHARDERVVVGQRLALQHRLAAHEVGLGPHVAVEHHGLVDHRGDGVEPDVPRGGRRHGRAERRGRAGEPGEQDGEGEAPGGAARGKARVHALRQGGQ